jgi:hypothetical protein
MWALRKGYKYHAGGSKLIRRGMAEWARMSRSQVGTKRKAININAGGKQVIKRGVAGRARMSRQQGVRKRKGYRR